MIEFDNALRIAQAAVVDPPPYNHIVEAFESSSEWIFCPGSPEDDGGGIDGGCFPIAISKETGKASTIRLPSIEGFARLDASEEVEIPR